MLNTKRVSFSLVVLVICSLFGLVKVEASSQQKGNFFVVMKEFAPGCDILITTTLQEGKLKDFEGESFSQRKKNWSKVPSIDQLKKKGNFFYLEGEEVLKGSMKKAYKRSLCNGCYRRLGEGESYFSVNVLPTIEHVACLYCMASYAYHCGLNLFSDDMEDFRPLPKEFLNDTVYFRFSNFFVEEMDLSKKEKRVSLQKRSYITSKRDIKEMIGFLLTTKSMNGQYVFEKGRIVSIDGHKPQAMFEGRMLKSNDLKHISYVFPYLSWPNSLNAKSMEVCYQQNIFIKELGEIVPVHSMGQDVRCFGCNVCIERSTKCLLFKKAELAMDFSCFLSLLNQKNINLFDDYPSIPIAFLSEAIQDFSDKMIIQLDAKSIKHREDIEGGFDKNNFSVAIGSLLSIAVANFSSHNV